MSNTLSSLRAVLTKQKLDGFILPVNDEFMGEYVPDSARRLTWLTGFTGSAGLAVVLARKAAFFTDGRYTLQARAEVKGFDLHNSGELAPERWVKRHAPAKSVIGYDPMLHTLSSLRRFQAAAPGVTFKPVTRNPVDGLWKNRPPAPDGPARIQPLKFAGESSVDKRKRIGTEIGEKADAALITLSDSVCWLLNMRGSDVPFTPFVLAYAVLTIDGVVTLYLDEGRVPAALKKDWGRGVVIRPPEALGPDMKKFKGKKVLYDSQSSPVGFHQLLTKVGAKPMEGPDPCQLPKARKNAAELSGTRDAHIRDGLAVTKFLYWLDGADKSTLTEMDIAAKLESFRAASNLYLGPSFTTISGSGPDGAIVHYRVTEATNRKLDRDSLLLVDSGGQYLDGTTDITRTIAMGTPGAEMKERFTRVLKGHIALARAVFPEGTCGSQLDVLARQYLWAEKIDYDHGTGHGVGSYLSVHEGPQRIGKNGGYTPLESGMILSNEPGYYKTGEYGIRIENLVTVKDVSQGKGKRWFGFETLTLVPIDLRAVDKSMLTAEETQWLEAYHTRVLEAHAPHLSAAERGWLEKAIKL